MFPIPWYVVIFESIPEALLLQILTIKLMNKKKVSFCKLLKVSMLYGVAAFFIRNIAFHLGQHFLFSLHTILLILVLALLFDLIHKIKFSRSFIPLFIVSVLFGLIQYTFVLIIFNLYKLNIYTFQESPWLNITLFIPVAGITYSIVCIYTKYAGEIR
ncbi:hypothetical protein TepRe1_2003 [Tepidanaerobacter acetatoxydans Re1]|nr:hypothetical protein TepRe1_2003 [Tepidanaerobacter acetatoxydans Re1]